MLSRIRWQVVRLSDGGLTVLTTHRLRAISFLVLWFFVLTKAGHVDYFQYLRYDIRRIKI